MRKNFGAKTALHPRPCQFLRHDAMAALRLKSIDKRGARIYNVNAVTFALRL